MKLMQKNKVIKFSDFINEHVLDDTMTHVDALETVMNFFAQIKDRVEADGFIEANEVECIEKCYDIVKQCAFLDDLLAASPVVEKNASK